MLMYSVVFAPLIFVILAIVCYRYGFRKRPFGKPSALVSLLAVAGAFFAPVAMGVWLPDLRGHRFEVARVSTDTGETISIIQYWNHVDFYNTEAHVTTSYGGPTVHPIDGDDARHWSIPIEIDNKTRTATFLFADGRRPTIRY